jgi:hypothetical protein
MSDEEFDGLRSSYQNGLCDARKVRQALFGDQFIDNKNALPVPPPRACIAGVSYEDALAKIDGAFKQVKQITARGLARASRLATRTGRGHPTAHSGEKKAKPQGR